MTRKPTIFQSTLPMRGATSYRLPQGLLFANFNPHSPCGERQRRNYHVEVEFCHFNPHSPCGERRSGSPGSRAIRDFNPHSPCGERRRGESVAAMMERISIHTPHAGSDNTRLCLMHFSPLFQSTLPMRGATATRSSMENPEAFQSTLPMRGATIVPAVGHLRLRISIHTPHAGSDERRRGKDYRLQNFNPHSPCGERLFRQLSHQLNT